MKVERVIDMAAFVFGISVLGREKTMEIVQRHPIYMASYRGVYSMGRTHAEALTKLFRKFVVNPADLGIKSEHQS